MEPKPTGGGAMKSEPENEVEALPRGGELPNCGLCGRWIATTHPRHGSLQDGLHSVSRPVTLVCMTTPTHTTTDPASGLTWTVRLVRKGDPYGLNLQVVHDKDDPMVEFYDTRHPHTEWGQFVSRYNLSTLREHPERGINLDGGIPDWSVSAELMSEVYAWLPDNVLDAMDAAQQTYCGADITAYDLRAKRGARPLSKSERGFACPDCLAVLDPKEQP